MRLPNGFGSVYKLSGRRRRPWVARKTIGWNEKGHPVYSFLGYYETREEALKALVTEKPELSKMTLSDLWDRWWEEGMETKSPNTMRNYASQKCVLRPLFSRTLSSIPLRDFQALFDQSGKNAPVLQLVKAMLSSMYAMAEQNEWINPDQNRIKYIKIKAGNPRKHDHSVFSQDEIQNLWKNRTEEGDVILFMLFTGLRISELLALTPSDVGDGCLLIRKAKTSAGVREVPVADKLTPILSRWLQKAGRSIFCRQNGDKMTRMVFLTNIWEKAVTGHSPHDTRHTFISLLVQAGVDDRVIKQIVGHAGKDVTENVYTHISLEKKKEVVDLLLACY